RLNQSAINSTGSAYTSARAIHAARIRAMCSDESKPNPRSGPFEQVGDFLAARQLQAEPTEVVLAPGRLEQLGAAGAAHPDRQAHLSRAEVIHAVDDLHPGRVGPPELVAERPGRQRRVQGDGRLDKGLPVAGHPDHTSTPNPFQRV